jgi:hypothetical protein
MTFPLPLSALLVQVLAAFTMDFEVAPRRSLPANR